MNTTFAERLKNAMEQADMSQAEDVYKRQFLMGHVHKNTPWKIDFP